MAENKTITAFGSKEKETKNQIRFTTEWGVIYLPKTKLAEIDNPERVKITVEGFEG